MAFIIGVVVNLPRIKMCTSEATTTKMAKSPCITCQTSYLILSCWRKMEVRMSKIKAYKDREAVTVALLPQLAKGLSQQFAG
jgi:hypothetical protein